MATNVGTLQANLTLNTSNFTRGMGKAISAAQQLGTSLSTALGRKAQSFSTVSNSAEKAASSMGTLKNSVAEVGEQAREVAEAFTQMTASMVGANPFQPMQETLFSILEYVDLIATEIMSMNAVLGNTNTQLAQMKTVFAGNSSFSKAEKSTKQIADSVGTANKKAKELSSNVTAVSKGGAAAAKSVDNIKQKLGEATFRAKDIKRILEGIVVSQAFYRLLSIMSELVSGSLQFMQNMEQTQLSFKYLLGDAQEAASLVEKLQDFAIKSPLDTSGAADATRYLLNMGFTANNVVEVLQTITDAAVVSGADVKETVHSISVALGQMLQSGTASAQEIRQLYNAGVPVAKLLNEQLGLTGKEVKNIGDLAIDSGTVVSAILQGMKNQFAGASQEMQETWAGAMSAIKDSIFVFANVAAEEMYGAFRDRIVAISNAMQYLVQIVRKFGPGGVFEALVPNQNWQAILRNVIGAFQQLGMAIQYWYKIIGTILGAVGKELVQILNIILPPITIMANFLMKLAYGFLQAAPAVKYFIATLVLLTIARPIISLMVGLWKTIGLGSICLKVAAYVRQLAMAIATLTIAHPVIAAITAIAAVILTLTGITQKAINKIKELISLLGGKLANFAKKNKTIDTGLNIGYDPNKILQPIDRETQKGTEDYADAVEDVADALDDVTDSAKKAGKSLKNNFNQSFDEVFTIDPKSTTAADILGFDPEELDLTPLEDFEADLGGLADFDFDFGGTLNNFMDAWRTMIDNMIKFAKKHVGSLAIALTGLLAGLALGNPWLALCYALVALFWEDLCEAFGIDVPNEAGIAAAIGAGLGTALGYLIGGKLGAYIGGAIGLLASTVFSIVLDRIAEKFNLGDYSKAVSAIGQGIGSMIGTAIGLVLGGPVGAAIGAAIGNLAGGLIGLIWGGLVEKLGAAPEQGIADLTAAIEGFLGAGISTALSNIIGTGTTEAAINVSAGALGSSLAGSIATGLAGGLLSAGLGLISTAIWSWIGKELDKTAEDMENAGIGGIAGSIVGALVGILITVFTGGFGALTIPICTAIGNAVGEGIGLFADDIAKWVDAKVDMAKQFGDYLKIKFEDAFETLDWNKLSTELGEDLGKTLGNGVNSGAKAFDTKVNKIQEAAWSFGDWLINDVPNWFLGLGEAIGTALGEAIGDIVTFFTITIPEKLNEIDFNAVCKDLGKKFGEAVGSALKSFTDFIDFISEIKNFISTTIENFITTIQETDWSQIGVDILKMIGTALADVFIALPASILESIGTFIYGLFDGFTSALSEVEWSTVGQNIIDGIMYIFSAPERIAEAISDGISNFFEGFYEGICEAFDINSPAETMKPVGENIINGILAGVTTIISSIKSWVNNNIYYPIYEAIKFYLDPKNWKTFGTNIITGIKKGVTSALQAIYTWISNNVLTPIKNAFSNLFTTSAFSGFGGNIITGLLNGIKNGLSNIWEWCRVNVYDRIYNTIKAQFGISSPAKEMMPLGDYIAAGLGKGISVGMTDVISDVQSEMKVLMEAFQLDNNSLVHWSEDLWSVINNNVTAAINKIQELIDLTSQSFSLQANMQGFNVSREGFATNGTTSGADEFADALVARLGPILAQNGNETSGAASEVLRPLYVGTLVADERGLRELEKKMRIITEAENERRGR